MNNVINVADRINRGTHDLNLAADVLVIGGGPAGAWAALAAVATGARVVLSDKGYLGTSGAHASTSGGAYYTVPNDPVQRQGQIVGRAALAFGLDEPDHIERVYDEAYNGLELMARWGFPWPRNREGKEMRTGLRGPDVMAFLRKRLLHDGVRILDHSPTLELLGSDGVVAGAAGINRQTGETWSVRAGAVVIATGGCAFGSGAMGTKGLTGDGYLLASEVGADFGSMEFSSQYAPSPKGSAITKTGMYEYGWRMWDGNGKEIKPGRLTAQALMETGKAFVILDKYDEDGARRLRNRQTAIFTFFDRMNIDPFKQPFEITLKLEGTVRACGGIAVGDNAGTTAPGLFAAGDVTDKRRLVGAAMSGAGPALAWTFASGIWSGRAAAAFAAQAGKHSATRRVESLGGAGLRPQKGRRNDLRAADVAAVVKEEIHPLEKNYFRSEAGLNLSLARLGETWTAVREGLASQSDKAGPDQGRDVLRTRETASMLATGRWMYAAALERTETRGIHRRSDFPRPDPQQQSYSVVSGGLDEVWARRETIKPAQKDSLAS